MSIILPESAHKNFLQKEKNHCEVFLTFINRNYIKNFMEKGKGSHFQNAKFKILKLNPLLIINLLLKKYNKFSLAY